MGDLPGGHAAGRGLLRQPQVVVAVPAPHPRRRRGAGRLQELGANSMDRAEIVMLVLESMDLAIARSELFGPQNIGELADLLHGKLHAS